MALYFCKEFWELYSKACDQGNERDQHRLLLQVANSSKPKHLASFLVRAKAFYKRASVIDKPMHQDEKADMELMQVRLPLSLPILLLRGASIASVCCLSLYPLIPII